MNPQNQDNPNLTTFTIHETGNVTGEKFDGAFVVKNRLSFRDQLRRDEIRRQILGESPNGTTPTPDANAAAVMLSETAVRIVDAPNFWTNANNGNDLFDDSVLIAVYKGCLKAEDDRLAPLRKKAEEAKAALEKATAEAPAAE
jgi:hypothetical protein